MAATSPVAPRRLLLLLHGARIYDPLVREAIHGLKEDGHEVTVRVTWDSGDVDRFVQEAALLDGARRFDTIVAGGGDGTLNELVAALLRPPGSALLTEGPTTTIAQLPLGTANDLASASGISLDPREALALAVDPQAARPIDVALVNGEVFLNIATVGPVSEVSSKDMSDAAKKALGPAAIIVSSIRQLLVTGLRPKQGVTITYPLNPSAAPPPPPEPQPCPPGQPCPPTRVLSSSGLAAPGALAGASSGPLLDAAAEHPPPAPSTPQARGGGGGGAARAPGAPQLGAAARDERANGRHQAGESEHEREDKAILSAPFAGDIDGKGSKSSGEAEVEGGKEELHQVLEAAGAERPGGGFPGAGLGRLRGDLLALVAGQSRQMGRMFNVCPHALLDDGLLDFTVLFGTPGQQAARLAADVAARGLAEAQGGILMLRAPWLLVEAGERLKTNRDGEPTLESSRLLFEVRPKAVRLHLPDSRLLVSGLPERERAAASHLVTPERPKHRRRLLHSLLRAQQPPGRMGRRLAGLRRMAVQLGWAAMLFGIGFLAGMYHGASI